MEREKKKKPKKKYEREVERTKQPSRSLNDGHYHDYDTLNDDWYSGYSNEPSDTQPKTAKKGLEQISPNSFRYTDNEITELHLNDEKELEGAVEIDCPKLEKLYCSDRKLTALNIKKCPKLKVLECWYNDLTNLDLSNNPDLEIVICFANRLKLNLNVFSHLTKLKNLDLGVECGGSGRINDFYGSLKSLQNCKRLERLCIGHNKRIREGLEYLPTGLLTYFGCHGNFYKEQLKPFDYDILTWRLFNYFHIFSDDKEERIEALEWRLETSKKELKKIEELLKEYSGYARRAERLKTKIEILTKECPNLESQIQQLKIN